MAIDGFWRGPAAPGGGYDDTAITARVTAVEGEVDALQAADATLLGRVAQAEADIAANADDIEALPAPYDDTALAGRVSALEEAPPPTWEEVTGKPDEFAPASHSHAIADVTGLQAALDDKLDAGRLVTLTQAEYDALGTPDPETFYFISG